MFEIKSNNLDEIEKSRFSTALKTILSDSSTNYIFGEKQMMVNCPKKYESVMIYLEDNGNFTGLGDDAYVTDIPMKIAERDIEPASKHYFKNIRIKSITYSENDVFVVITYQWVLNIDDKMLKEFNQYVKEIEYDKPIDSKFYKKYRKYFSIYGNSVVDFDCYKRLAINNDGQLVYKRFPFVVAMPAICNC